MFSTVAYAQTPSDFDHRFIPNKMLQNSEGVIQVYAKNNTTPTNIMNLVATSSDSSIIKIVGIEPDKNNFMTDVKIKTGVSGTANIALAAPGFSSQEFPVIVNKNDDAPTNLLIKTTPNTFSTTGPKQGYVSVEFANSANLPTRATQDTSIALSTSNSDILTLDDNVLFIKKGSYFAIGKFEIKKDGIAQISAAAPNMLTVSSTVTITTVGTQQSIQLFVYPTKINDYSNSNAYIIAQLHDSAGNPVQATSDIPVSVQISDTSTTTVNTSTETADMASNEPLVIKKGSYWGYSKLIVNAGTNDTFNLGISAKGYTVPLPISLKPTSAQLYDTKSAKLDILPILATGQEELIGVLHLEDSNGNPVMASSKFLTEIDSSNPASLSIDNVLMEQGSDSALVFGKVGNTIPNPVTLNVVTQNSQIVTPTITLPTQKSYTLVAESLIPQVLAHDDYLTAVYLLDANNALTTFPKDMTTFVASNDYVQIESKLLPKDQSIVLLDSQSLKEGTTTVSLMAGDYQSNINVNNISSKPSSIFVDYPAELLSNLGNTFSIQLLNSQQLPVFADHDMNIKLVSSDPSVLNVPDSVVIKQGNYYSLFDVVAKNAGSTELAVLSDELPLAKYTITITNLTPDITISSNDHVSRNTVLDAKVIAQYHGTPLDGMKVDWQVKGAEIQTMNSITDKDGSANISVLVQDPTSVDMQVSVTGGIYGTTTVTKSISVNPPLGGFSAVGDTTDTGPFNIMGSLLVITPIAAAAAGGIVILKKKNMLDGITEKINIPDRIAEIKERIADLRQR